MSSHGGSIHISGSNISGVVATGDVNLSSPPRSAPDTGRDRVLPRLGVGVDLVSYSATPTAGQPHRLASLPVLRDAILRSVGIALGDAIFQNTGDGFLLFLPPDQEPHRGVNTVLLGVKTACSALSAAGNKLPVRVTLGYGLAGQGEWGIDGTLVVELHRVLNSEEFRRWGASQNPRPRTLAILDSPYREVVEGGFLAFDDLKLRLQPLTCAGRSAWVAEL